MKFLVVFARVEIWALIALIVAVIAFATCSDSGELVDSNDPPQGNLSVSSDPVSEPDSGEVIGSQEAQTALNVSAQIAERSDSGWRIELALEGLSPSEQTIELNESTVAVETESGAELGWFFKPFREQIALSPTEQRTATIDLWLTNPPADRLLVTLGGETFEASLNQ
ncbi:MAG: hypothetical protein AAF236_04325 [Verrucomicrobiota bacterium]